MTTETTARNLTAIPDQGPFVATIHAPDGVRFTAAATTRDELVSRLADYVRENAPLQLWPADALRVRALLHLGDLEAAVELYFERVGERWDEEWLTTTTAPADEGVFALG